MADNFLRFSHQNIRGDRNIHLYRKILFCLLCIKDNYKEILYKLDKKKNIHNIGCPYNLHILHQDKYISLDKKGLAL
jgi:hypothetical protein